MKKKWLSIVLAVTMVFSLAACGGETAEEQVTPAVNQNTSVEENTPPAENTPMAENTPVAENTPAEEQNTETTDKSVPSVEGEEDSWAVYWYLCGSDLESGGGFATGDLMELMEVTLPENVNVVIETGGSTVWQNDVVDASRLQRWLYNSEGLTLVDEQPSASMGEAQTLADFLHFAKTNYPAERTAVVFWNHGGGSVTGAAFDELYGFDSLTLGEMYAAFSSVWEPSGENQPLELIGFDTCLMATVDVAYTFCDIAKYLVASEETEPANGWYYSQWVGALAENPSMNGIELGKVICDAYYAGCVEVGTQDNTTLSLTDLSKVGPLLEAYETFGAEALAAACTDPAFFSQFGRVAAQSENYGGNTKEQGYTNMVDLGHMARQSMGILGSSQGVLDALEECVLYQVGGQYRTEATGLSCYYSYNGDVDDFNGYAGQGAGSAFKYFYSYGLAGELDDTGMEYIAGMNFEELPEIQNLTTMGWDGAPLEVNEEGTAFMTLGPEAYDILAGIGFSLYYVDEAGDMMMLLGTDNDMTADWDNGVFYDNFRGVWGSIDGNLVYMELSFEGEDYNLYSVPVLINGEEYNLQVVYDFTLEQWSILGARQGIDEHGMADKEMRLLQVGDEITTIWYMATYSGEDDFEPYAVQTVTVTEDTAFAEMSLPDGSYMMMFEMRDAMGNYAYSDAVTFDCIDNEIYTTVYED
ncbi:MAG: hypothetical protein J6J42_05470 [Lachnospiraceae bacterium]|nr:hypothetical protein [Lachnospiraceae bacterium]